MSKIKYLDPYKDISYARLKGDKASSLFKVEFAEGKFHKTDSGYVLMADVLFLNGVVKAFKPEEGLPSPVGMCAIPIYSKDYELWDKKENKSITISPTIHEKNLCGHLDMTISEDKHYRGSITLLPNDNFTNLSDADISNLVSANCQLLEATASGKLPVYEEFSPSNYKKNGSYKLTPTEKLKILKEELADSIQENGFNGEMSLIDLVDQIATETKNENTLAIYVDFIKAIFN